MSQPLLAAVTNAIAAQPRRFGVHSSMPGTRRWQSTEKDRTVVVVHKESGSVVIEVVANGSMESLQEYDNLTTEAQLALAIWQAAGGGTETLAAAQSGE